MPADARNDYAPSGNAAWTCYEISFICECQAQGAFSSLEREGEEEHWAAVLFFRNFPWLVVMFYFVRRKLQCFCPVLRYYHLNLINILFSYFYTYDVFILTVLFRMFVRIFLKSLLLCGFCIAGNVGKTYIFCSRWL